MELRHLRYFIAVSEEMNFSKAADKLAIAQPPLSRQIQDLEAELGVTLFNRKRHALSLTDEGILFKQYALQVLELVEQSTNEVKELKHGLQGMINLGTVEGNAPRLLSQWIAGFNKENPNVQYTLWNGNSDDVAQRVMNGLCEIAIIMEPHNGVGLEFIPIYQEKWVAIIPKDHPLAASKAKTVSMDEIAEYDLIIPSRDSRLAEIGDWIKSTKKAPKVRARVANVLSAYELTRQNLGIAIFPGSARNTINTDDVVIKEFKNPAPTASYILVWNKHRSLSHASSEFLNYIKNTQKNK